jgi:hypothetical protein
MASRCAGLDSLRVAAGALDHGRVDRDEAAVAFLLALAAAFADGDDDLVGRPAVVARAAEDVARHHREGLLVVELAAVGLAEGVDRLTEECEHVGRDVEAEDVASRFGVRRIRRPVAGDVIADELLDLAHGAGDGGSEPFGLGLGDDDAGQLADGGVAELAGFERVVEMRQRLEGTRGAEALDDRSRDRRRRRGERRTGNGRAPGASRAEGRRSRRRARQWHA